MNQEKIHEIVENQRAYFRSGKTLPIKFRIEQLKKLKEAVIKFRPELEEALSEDLGRAPLEAYFCDIGSLLMEINEAIKGLKRWARPETHFSGFHCFPSVYSKVYKMPYGVSLIISPFNFPIFLSLGVLVPSIAGGNTAIIKASSKSKKCTEVLQKLIKETYPEEYATVIDGGHDVADMCLAERFDKIFYTGSPRVGVHVLTEAAKNLTSTALELGGETGNWCIVRKDADLKDAARKIAFFKILNSGQICININQIAVAKEIADEFIKELKKAFATQIGEDPVNNPEYPRLINRAAYDKCVANMEGYKERVIYGGTGCEETCKFAPTIIYPVDISEEIVQKELFCPLLPVVPFEDSEVETVLNTIAEREHGLSLYLFTKNISWAKKTMQRMQYGGGCINEVCIHMMVKGMPFNGTGHSGMGAYHGEWGFREFTHPAAVLVGSNKFNLSLREHPYTGSLKEKLIRMVEK